MEGGPSEAAAEADASLPSRSLPPPRPAAAGQRGEAADWSEEALLREDDEEEEAKAAACSGGTEERRRRASIRSPSSAACAARAGSPCRGTAQAPRAGNNVGGGGAPVVVGCGGAADAAVVAVEAALAVVMVSSSPPLESAPPPPAVRCWNLRMTVRTEMPGVSEMCLDVGIWVFELVGSVSGENGPVRVCTCARCTCHKQNYALGLGHELYVVDERDAAVPKRHTLACEEIEPDLPVAVRRLWLWWGFCVRVRVWCGEEGRWGFRSLPVSVQPRTTPTS